MHLVPRDLGGLFGDGDFQTLFRRRQFGNLCGGRVDGKGEHLFTAVVALEGNGDLVGAHVLPPFSVGDRVIGVFLQRLARGILYRDTRRLHLAVVGVRCGGEFHGFDLFSGGLACHVTACGAFFHHTAVFGQGSLDGDGFVGVT